MSLPLLNLKTSPQELLDELKERADARMRKVGAKGVATPPRRPTNDEPSEATKRALDRHARLAAAAAAEMKEAEYEASTASYESSDEDDDDDFAVVSLEGNGTYFHMEHTLEEISERLEATVAEIKKEMTGLDPKEDHYMSLNSVAIRLDADVRMLKGLLKRNQRNNFNYLLPLAIQDDVKTLSQKLTTSGRIQIERLLPAIGMMVYMLAMAYAQGMQTIPDEPVETQEPRWLPEKYFDFVSQRSAYRLFHTKVHAI